MWSIVSLHHFLYLVCVQKRKVQLQYEILRAFWTQIRLDIAGGHVRDDIWGEMLGDQSDLEASVREGIIHGYLDIWNMVLDTDSRREADYAGADDTHLLDHLGLGKGRKKG